MQIPRFQDSRPRGDMSLARRLLPRHRLHRLYPPRHPHQECPGQSASSFLLIPSLECQLGK